MKRWAVPAVILAVALAIAGVLSHFASSSPDGLERVAEDQGFSERAQPQPGHLEVMPDYEVPGAEGSVLGNTAAALAGTLIVFALSLSIGWALRRRRPPPDRS